MNSVDYYMIGRQKDTEGPDGCKDRDFRLCGNMTVDIPLVTARLRHMLAIARPLVGLKDGINTSDDLSLSTDTFGNTISYIWIISEYTIISPGFYPFISKH
jgi:hypothetical protein